MFLIYVAGETQTAGEIVGFIFLETLGSLATGLLFGVIMMLILPFLKSKPTPLVAITLVLPYITFYFSVVFEMSGVLSLVPLGLVVHSFGRGIIVGAVEERMHHFWDQVEFLTNTVLFSLSGLVVAKEIFSGNITARAWGYLVLLYFFLLAVRAVTMLVLFPVLKKCGYGMSWEEAVFSWWGGLRGAVGLTLALSIRGSEGVSDSQGSLISFFMAGIVVLTLCINAPLSRFVLRALHLQDIPSEILRHKLEEQMYDTAISLLKIAKVNAGSLESELVKVKALHMKLHHSGKESQGSFVQAVSVLNSGLGENAVDEEQSTDNSVIYTPDSKKMINSGPVIETVNDACSNVSSQEPLYQPTEAREDSSKDAILPADPLDIGKTGKNEICLEPMDSQPAILEEHVKDEEIRFTSPASSSVIPNSSGNIGNGSVVADKRRHFLLTQKVTYSRLLDEGLISPTAWFFLTKSVDVALDTYHEVADQWNVIVGYRFYGYILKSLLQEENHRGIRHAFVGLDKETKQKEWSFSACGLSTWAVATVAYISYGYLAAHREARMALGHFSHDFRDSSRHNSIFSNEANIIRRESLESCGRPAHVLNTIRTVTPNVLSEMKARHLSQMVKWKLSARVLNIFEIGLMEESEFQWLLRKADHIGDIVKSMKPDLVQSSDIQANVNLAAHPDMAPFTRQSNELNLTSSDNNLHFKCEHLKIRNENKYL